MRRGATGKTVTRTEKKNKEPKDGRPFCFVVEGRELGKLYVLSIIHGCKVKKKKKGKKQYQNGNFDVHTEHLLLNMFAIQSNTKINSK